MLIQMLVRTYLVFSVLFLNSSRIFWECYFSNYGSFFCKCFGFWFFFPPFSPKYRQDLNFPLTEPLQYFFTKPWEYTSEQDDRTRCPHVLDSSLFLCFLSSIRISLVPYFFILLWLKKKKTHNMKFTILIFFKYTVQYC